MLNANSSRSKWSMVFLTLAMAAAFSVAMHGQDAPAVHVGNTEIKGVPDDWTHHHVVFANAGTEQHAIQTGHHAEWQKVVNDPRYVMQQLKRHLPVQGPAAVDAKYREQWNSEASPRFGRAFEPTAQMLNGQFTQHIDRLAPGPVKISASKVTVKKDWSMSLAGAAVTGAMAPGQYPAKYSFSTSTASCSDFVVYPTGLAGAAGQASIVAYTNMYVGGGCGANNPTYYFAYNTGGTSTLSPVLSLDGTQAAFIQTNGTTASLVVLHMASSGGTVAAPTFGAGNGSVAAGAYRTCVAPCYTAVAFNNAANDTTSSPFYDYFADVLYVGDATGNVHKFTNIFKTGTPTELIGGGTASGWPQNMAAAVALTSPVFDQVSGNVFVGSNAGIVYRIPGGGAATGGGSSNKVASGQIAVAGGADFSDSPLVDSTPGTPLVYVFEGDASAVTQLSATFLAGNLGVTNTLGTSATTSLQYIGAFDNLHYLGDGTTGNLYVCGYHATGTEPRFFQVVFPFSATSTVNQITQDPSGAAGTCSPVSEVLGSKANTTLSAAISGTPTTTTLAAAINHATAPATTFLSAAITTTTATTVTVNSGTNILVGDYIVVGTEDMFVSAKPTATTLTVVRGANATTAATHANFSTVTISATLITVPTAAPVTTGELIEVDSEFMSVTATHATAGVGLTLTVTRGANGTTAATHANGATVTLPTAVSVASGTGIVAGDFLEVDSEIMTVNSVSGTTVNVLQGALGTTAAAHASGAGVQDIQDWAFLSVSTTGAGTGCALTTGCLYNYSITTGALPADATAGISAIGGTSGIVIDNSATTAGASQIYYTTRGAATCGGNGATGTGTHGCAVQASQSAP